MHLSRRAASIAFVFVALSASARASAQDEPATPPASPPPPPAAAPAAAAGTAVPAPAADPSRSLPAGESELMGSRTLSGHTFQRPVFLDSAFLAGYFGDGTRIGFESAQLTAKEQLNVAAVFETLAFGIPIGKRVQLSFDGNYNAFFGTDTQSLFKFGGNFGFNLQPGLRVLIVRSDRTGSELSLHGSAVIAYSPGVTPGNLIQILGDELNGITTNQHRLECLLKLKFRCAFPGVNNILAAIETSSTSFGGDLSINYAQALGRYVGLQATGGIDAEASTFNAYAGTKKTSQSSAPITVEGGLGPSVNLYPLAPVGMQLEYLARFSTQSSGGNATNSLQHNFAVGFYFTGRRDLQLGINGTVSIDNDTQTLRNGMSNTTTFNAYTGAFGLYYYF
jgi:hypothetical protein